MNRANVAGAVGALLVISGLIVQTSTAAFTATTDNSGNSWAAGSVSLRDNDSGAAMFAETALKPGSTGSRCIVVTYDGNLAANVRLRAATTGGTGLGDYLNLTVNRGTGGAADCSDFASTEAVYGGTVTGLATTHSTFATGAGSWAPTGAGQASTYRFTWTLADNNNAQGKSVQSTFTWEAQNS